MYACSCVRTAAAEGEPYTPLVCCRLLGWKLHCVLLQNHSFCTSHEVLGTAGGRRMKSRISQSVTCSGWVEIPSRKAYAILSLILWSLLGSRWIWGLPWWPAARPQQGGWTMMNWSDVLLQNTCVTHLSSLLLLESCCRNQVSSLFGLEPVKKDPLQGRVWWCRCAGMMLSRTGPWMGVQQTSHAWDSQLHSSCPGLTLDHCKDKGFLPDCCCTPPFSWRKQEYYLQLCSFTSVLWYPNTLTPRGLSCGQR